MAIQRQMDQRREIHGNLERMIRDDPAAFVQKLPEMFGPVIAQMVAQGLVQGIQALAQQPVAQRVKVADRICATCLLMRIAWNSKYEAELKQAQATAMAQVGATDPMDPRVAQMDVTPFLPERLRPGQLEGPPPLFDAAITVNGTEYCPNHHPDAPQQQARGRLILMPGIPVHAAARIALGGQPGMPGMATG